MCVTEDLFCNQKLHLSFSFLVETLFRYNSLDLILIQVCSYDSGQCDSSLQNRFFWKRWTVSQTNASRKVPKEPSEIGRWSNYYSLFYGFVFALEHYRRASTVLVVPLCECILKVAGFHSLGWLWSLLIKSLHKSMDLQFLPVHKSSLSGETSWHTPPQQGPFKF